MVWLWRMIRVSKITLQAISITKSTSLVDIVVTVDGDATIAAVVVE